MPRNRKGVDHGKRGRHHARHQNRRKELNHIRLELEKVSEVLKARKGLFYARCLAKELRIPIDHFYACAENFYPKIYFA